MPTIVISHIVSFSETPILRQDPQGVRRRIIDRGYKISEREFRASFPIGFDCLSGQNAIPFLTSFAGRKSSGKALFTLKSSQTSEQLSPDIGHYTLSDLVEKPDMIAGAVYRAETPIPICKQLPNRPVLLLAYALKPIIAA